MATIINESENKRNTEKANASLAIASNEMSSALAASLNERETKALQTFGDDAIPFIKLARVDKITDWTLAAHLYNMGLHDFKEPINGIKYKGLGEYAVAIADMLGVKMDGGKASNYRKIHDVFIVTDPADVIAKFNEDNGYSEEMTGLYMTDERYMNGLKNWAFNALILLTRTGLKTPELENFAINIVLNHLDGMKIDDVKELVKAEKERNKTGGEKKKRQLVEKLTDGDGENILDNGGDNNGGGNNGGDNSEEYTVAIDELSQTISSINAAAIIEEKTVLNYVLTPTEKGFTVKVLYK